MLRSIPWDSCPEGAVLDSPGRGPGNTWPPQPIKAQRAVTRWRSRVTARWALRKVWHPISQGCALGFRVRPRWGRGAKTCVGWRPHSFGSLAVSFHWPLALIQFLILPRLPLYCRLTPAVSRPLLTVPVSSTHPIAASSACSLAIIGWHRFHSFCSSPTIDSRSRCNVRDATF